MMLLAGTGSCQDAREIEAALAAGFVEHLALPRGAVRALVKGDLPDLELISVDLSSAHIDPSGVRPVVPAPPLEKHSSVRATRFEATACPLQVGGATVSKLSLVADNASFDIASDSRNQRWLALSRVARGAFHLDIGPGELERLVLAGLQEAAAGHGVRIEDLRLGLSSGQQGVVNFEAEATGRKGFLRGGLVVGGCVRIDSSCNAVLSALTCSGRGAIGAFVAPWLQPTLRKWEGKSFSPFGQTLEGAECRDVRITVGQGSALRAEGVFGMELEAGETNRPASGASDLSRS